MRQTNPISGYAGWGEAPGSRDAGAIVRHRLDAPLRETNPICPAGPGGPPSPLWPRPRQADCAKRSQTWAPWGICGTTRGGSLLCKTNPIRHWRAEKTIARAFGLDAATHAEANRAKRTQLPEAGHRGGVRPWPVGRDPGDEGCGGDCAKRSQFVWRSMAGPSTMMVRE
jgi:hypothetical protein